MGETTNSKTKRVWTKRVRQAKKPTKRNPAMGQKDHFKSITSLGFADAFYMKPLNTLYNTVLRIIANCGYRTKLSPVYKTQNILKLEDIHKLQLGKLMFKIINYGKPQQYRVLFSKSREIHNCLTRQAKNESIYISQIKTNSRKKSI